MGRSRRKTFPAARIAGGGTAGGDELTWAEWPRKVAKGQKSRAQILWGYEKGTHFILIPVGSQLRVSLKREYKDFFHIKNNFSFALWRMDREKTKVNIKRPCWSLLRGSRWAGTDTEDFPSGPPPCAKGRSSAEAKWTQHLPWAAYLTPLGKHFILIPGHHEPGPPCKCLNNHFDFQAIEKVKAVPLFNFV